MILYNVPDHIMKKHEEILKLNKKVFISENPENGKELSEESIKLIRTFNNMEEFDFKEHDLFYDNSIAFVKDEISSIRDKIVGVQNEIKKTYSDLSNV